MGDTTRLVLIRHGESVCAVEGVAGGHRGCTGLTPTGRDQAARLRDRLVATGELGKIDAVVTSTLARAVETAAILAPALGGAEAEQSCDFCEHHVGEADGLPDAEVRARFGEWVWGDPDWRPAPGAETRREFADRVAGAVRRTIAEHRGRTVVAVVHGGVIEHAFLGITGQPAPAWIPLVNTSLTIWDHDEATPVGEWRLERLNDFAHLLPGVSFMARAPA